MKKKTYSYIALFALCLTLLSISCSDNFIDQPAIGAYDESVLANKEGINSLLIGCYAQLNGTNNGFSGMLSSPWTKLLGDVRGGEAIVGTEAGDGASWEPFATWYILPTTSFLPNVFQFYYNAISMTNQLVGLVPDASDMTDEEKTIALAEAKFLRAHYYYMLKRVWGNIPWVDETDGINVKKPNADENGNYIDCWPNIEADMKYAADNLPETQTEFARANSWAAKAYLVKLRMAQKKYDAETYNLCLDVVNNGVTSKGEAYGLMPNYHDNFDPEQENNKENVFQVQISVNGYAMSGFGWFSGDNTINPDNVWIGTQRPGSPGYGRGWGYYAPSQWFVDKFRVNPSDSLPYLDYYATNSNPVKNDYGLASTDPFTPTTEPLDPRLDWMVGRRGIPYLDWGVMPGTDWLRDATGKYNGPYLQKKWMYYKAFEGVHNYTGSALNAINGHIIRFSDVLLWAAELEVRVNSNLDAAVGYVNQVRARMQNPEGWVKNEEGSAPAANYKIGLYDAFASSDQALDAILFERSLELGLEGNRFFDVVRFGSTYIQKELQNYVEFQSQFTAYLNGVTFNEGIDELAPFNQSAIINSQINGVPTLTQNPGY
jgi:hypothetical protein